MAEATQHIAAERLAVSIISPTATLYQGEALFLVVPGKEGIIGIYPGHTKIVSLLRKGDIIITGDAGEQTIAIADGILTITHNQVSLIVTQ